MTNSPKPRTYPSNLGYNPDSGIPFQCRYCPAQAFRRSRLRVDDLKHFLMMRYPVRCLRCSQRQPVSFTVAALSTPSYVRQRRARQAIREQKRQDVAETSSTPNDSHNA